MRIQKPRELLKVLALYNDNIDVEGIMARLGPREKKTIGLKRKVPVDITYLTAYIDPYGYLNFRNDIYHYDKYQLEHYAYNPRRKKPEAGKQAEKKPAEAEKKRTN
jgi:murein L,D-transpeptidase YcbB/YkuD